MRTDYLKEEVFSKFVSRETDSAVIRSQRAENKWLAVEMVNASTEERLMMTEPDFNILQDVSYSSFVEFCCGVVSDIIGDTAPEEALLGSFSGGASTSRKRTSSQPAHKYVGKAHVTDDCLWIVDNLVACALPGWLFVPESSLWNIEVVPGNVMFTVPKKTDIDRVAAKEPDLNMFIQKGIGDFFRSSLRRIGINLNDQTKNQSLAHRGSVDGSLATLDLSSASDSVTRELVFQLLPVSWFTLLDAARCPVTRLWSGEEHRNCMFSSMGNGFTFELESLLFYALMRTTAYFTGTRGTISVYGDDIIIPTGMAREAQWVLNYFGFEVNPDKSHVDGPFRESCGGHYWNGVDVTPFYIKGPLDRIVDVIDVANKLRRWGDLRIGGERFSSVIDTEVEAIWLWLKSYVPSCLWGGADLSFKYQLVSDDIPNSRLQEVAERKDAGLGGYLHWLNSARHRTVLQDAVVTSQYTTPRNQFRLRPVRDKTVPRLEAYFLHEIG